ncbi:MAG: glycosyltransferase family 2 protein [Bacteroidota bacterium]
MLKVSVIIPCYNVSQYIYDCLNSVTKQTYTNIEVICVDDGSTDDTLQILEKLKQEKFPQIQILAQKNNGASVARNFGLSKSTGDYIQFLDADDIILPNKLEKQVELVKQDNYPSIFVGSAIEQDESGTIVKKRVYDTTPDNYWMNLLNADLGDTCANLFKKETLLQVGAWDENLKSSQEYDLMFRILKVDSHIVFDSNINTTIKVRSSGSISKTNIKDNWLRFIELRYQIIHHLKTNNIVFNESIANQIVFDAIRFLYDYDKAKALELFKTKLPTNFKPQQSKATGKLYLLLYAVFGFKLTQKIKSLI